MKSKKSIKGILLMTAIVIASAVFLNMSLAANTQDNNNQESTNTANEEKAIEQTDNTTQGVSNQEESQNTKDNQVATQNATEETKTEELGAYIVMENTKLKLVPLINATDMTEVKKDDNINVVKIINGWAYADVNSTTRGWIRLNKIKTKSDVDKEKAAAEAEAARLAAEAEANATAIKTVYVKSESVNLRKEENADSELLGNLPQNTAIEVLSEANEWSKCRVNGLIGYISTQYLSDTKIETSRASTSSRTSTTTEEVPALHDIVASSSSGSTSVVSCAEQYLGCSYVYGATGPSSFDCSGFTTYVYKQFGVSLNRTAQGQYSNGTAVSDLQAGDLVMFGSSTSNIWHVGIYIGGGQFIHAANPSRGVTTDTLLSGYYSSNYVGARRVM